MNFKQCVNCNKKQNIHIKNKISQEDEDGVETVKYERMFLVLLPLHSLAFYRPVLKTGILIQGMGEPLFGPKKIIKMETRKHIFLD